MYRRSLFFLVSVLLVFMLAACAGEEDALIPGGGGSAFTGGYSGEPALFFTAFCPDNQSSLADAGGTWVDIGINDVSALPATWTVKCGNYEYMNTLLSSSELSSWSLANGDVIRIHEDTWTGSSDSSKGDNNAGLWDFKTSSDYSINYQYGSIWIEDGFGTIIDIVSYTTANNGDSYWLENSNDDPLSVLTTAVSGGHWTGDSISDAFSLGATSSVYARLTNWTADGQSASDWQSSSTAIDYSGAGGGTTGSTGSTGTTGSTGGGGSGTYDYIVDGKFQPQASDSYYSYYSSAAGLSGDALRTALKTIITSGHSVTSYSGLWTAYGSSDRIPSGVNSGKIWDMYSDHGDGTGSSYYYTYSSGQCGSYTGEGSCYNREHSWPKSWFSDASPMYSDIVHVVPTDGYVNGRRSNYVFGEVGTATWTSQNGSKLGSARSGLGYSGTVFEPIDVFKGDFARIYFYMCTRYWGTSEGSGMSSNFSLLSWAQTMLVSWHNADAVSSKETARNTAIQSTQGNRNPFVDYPGLVTIIDFTN